MKRSFLGKNLDRLLVLMTILVMLIRIVTNLNYDGEYQIAMGYRLLSGDRPLLEMWEPHQTSAFLIALCMKLYLAVTGTTTGIVVYLQAVGVLIQGCLAVLLYRTLCRVSPQRAALAAALLYALISARELMLPEFGNQQLWFGTILFLALFRYAQSGKRRFLILGAVSLCFQILSYPADLLVYFAVCVFVWRNAKRRGDIAVFTVVCAAIGLAVAGYYFHGLTPEMVRGIIRAVLTLEPSHTVGLGKKAAEYFRNLAEIAGMLAIIGAIGFLLERAAAFFFAGEKSLHPRFGKWAECSYLALEIFFLVNILSARSRLGHIFLLLGIIGFGLAKRKLLEGQERMVYELCAGIGGMSMLATLILSDQPFLLAVPMGMLWVCGSTLPIWRSIEKSRDRLPSVLAVGCVCLFAFRSVFLLLPISGRNQICTPLEDLALVRTGPAAGLITNEEGAVRQRDSFREAQEYLCDGDKIWYLGGVVDTLGYLYRNTEIAAPSVMSTPTYNESISVYYEFNPDKLPDVLMLASSYGELSSELASNEWLMRWIEEEFRPVQIVDGNYWRYYYRVWRDE